jgi:hypothetical protein
MKGLQRINFIVLIDDFVMLWQCMQTVNLSAIKIPSPGLKPPTAHNLLVTKAIDNNEERKGNYSTETQDFNMENPLQQREVKTTGASQQNFTISGVCLQTAWVIL